MPRENLKEKLDGNELDLSLNNLTQVPVKELVRFLQNSCGWGCISTFNFIFSKILVLL